MWLFEASCFPWEADRLSHTCTEAHCYLSPWRCQNAGCCCSIILSRVVLVESAHKAAASPAPNHPADVPPHPPHPARVDASCLSISTSTRSWLWLGVSREGSRMQITFNFIGMNSRHSQERAAELCDAAAAWRGRLLLCNWSRTHDSVIHCYQPHVRSRGNARGYFLLAQLTWICRNDGCDSSNVGSDRGILLPFKSLHW